MKIYRLISKCHRCSFLTFIVFSLYGSTGFAQFFEIDASDETEIARFNGGVYPYVTLYSDDRPFARIGDLIGARYDLALSTTVENADASLHLLTGQYGKNLTLNSVGDVGIGTKTPGAKLEVDGYTKLGSGETSPALKIIQLDFAATSEVSISVPHGLANGFKILQIFARASIYNNGSQNYYMLPILRWTNNRIVIDQEPIHSSIREGQAITVLITYYDQKDGQD